MTKTNAGHFFEDFELGQVLNHATPRTVTAGDRALYTALYPTRFALASSDEFARASGLPASPLEDLIGFHVVFGKTVPDVSLNAVANLGYAEGRFHRPVWPGRHIVGPVGSHRTASELEWEIRCCLGAHDRHEPER